MNNSGKTLTIFLVIIVILLISLTAIATFFYQKEMELNKVAVSDVAKLKSEKSKLEQDLAELKKKNTVLEEKIKESDQKINSLLDDLELEGGLREEMKLENQALKESLEQEKQTQERIRDDMASELQSTEDKLSTLQTELQQATDRNKELEDLNKGLQEQLEQLKAAQPQAMGTDGSMSKEGENKDIQLDTIVIAPKDMQEGQVLTVDKETNFLIFNLGQTAGIVEGLLLSVYRGDQYLGDIRVSRVQPDLSAADFIPPLSAKDVRKNDRVIAKQ